MRLQSDNAVYGLIGVLQKCRKSRETHEAKRLLAYVRHHELERHAVIGNYLVPMLVECGSLPDAHWVFDNLSNRNEHSWTSLISGYASSGQPKHALQLYRRMEDESCVQSNRHTYVVLLQACARTKDIKRGQSLHHNIIAKGLERDIFYGSAAIGNILVDMYGKCGFLVEAQHVFEGMPIQNTVSWASLIAGYADHGLTNEARLCFQEMQLKGIPPDSVTLVCCLKACGSAEALNTGYLIHLEAAKKGLESALFVGSALIDMYIKYSLIADAQQVFDGLPVRDAVPWASLIAGYAELGLDEEVLKMFRQMQHESISPDSVTIVCSLKSCGTVGAIETGKEIHAHVTKVGLEGELYVGSILVDMYSKCQCIAEGQQVFISLEARDVVSWNALISGYAELGLDDKVMRCFQSMQSDGIAPDHVTFICTLKACGSLKFIEIGRRIHAEIVKRGMDCELYVMNTLVDMYTQCDLLEEGRVVFDKQPSRDAVSWAALIAGYAEHECDDEVLNCYHRMQLKGLSPDSATFVFTLRACCISGVLEIGREVHIEVTKRGLERELYVGSALVEMYTVCGSMVEGGQVFDKLHTRSSVSWNALIMAYGKSHMSDRVLKCFEDMQEQGVKPDAITFTSLLAACSHANLVDEGHKYFEIMIKEYDIKPTIEHYACVVDLLARSGHVCQAEKVVAGMQFPPSTVIIMALLTACKVYGEVGMGEKCFQQLLEFNLEGAAAYLLMEDIYSSVGRWRDADKVGEVRSYAGAKKKPGSALIEVNKKSYEFSVGVDHNVAILEATDLLYARLENAGYVPNLDLIIIHKSNVLEGTSSFESSHVKSHHFRNLVF